jgi:hypothetical protein
MRRSRDALLNGYLWGLGVGLLIQGSVTALTRIVLPSAATTTHGVINHDGRHGLLHIIWGLAVLIVQLREPERRVQARVAITFGIFYVGLGVLGVLTHDPFGLHLGAGENGFHFIVGPVALALGLLAIRAPAATRYAVADGRAAGSGP